MQRPFNNDRNSSGQKTGYGIGGNASGDLMPYKNWLKKSG
jgi:hypothetical protein